MFDHIGLSVKNLNQSVEFYSAALAELGYVLCSRDESSAGFGPAGEPTLWLYAAAANKAAAATHVALRARRRQAVDGFHARGLDAGGSDNGAPGLRIDYGPSYYAAFLRDPDGNNLEAVCLD